jgi:beta-lactamase regulating signal transducer with metallopeptidase domain
MNPGSWLTEDFVRTVGWVLVHFLWQGTALASALYVALALCRTANSRYAAGLGTLLIMTACPFVTFALLVAHSVPTPEGMVMRQTATAIQTAVAASPLGTGVKPFDWLTVLVAAWFAGVFLFSLRAAGGCLMVERLRRESAIVTEDLLQKCAAIQQRLGLSRKVQYRQSELIDSPSAIGWLRPMVLLPIAAIAGLSPRQLEAVIAHELAHIQRFDYLANIVQIAAETLLFYHPAVWWVNRSIRREREHCCDDAAVVICGDAADYARALTTLEQWRGTPTLVLAATGGSLRARVARVLGMPRLRTSAPRAGAAVAGVICAATVLFAGTRITGTVTRSGIAAEIAMQAPEPVAEAVVAATPSVSAVNPSKARPATRVTPAAMAAPETAATAKASAAASASPVVAVTVATTAAAAAAVSATPSVSVSPYVSVSPVFAEIAEAQSDRAKARGDQPPSESYIGSLDSLGYKDLSADDIIALKVQGITPQYIRDMKATGLKPTLSDLVAMKVQGITPAYVSEMRAKGFQPSAGELVAMKVQGVTPEYVDRMRAKGFPNLSIGQIIALKVQNVDPADAAQYKQLGIHDVSVNDLVALHVQGVTPAYIRAMQAAGFTSAEAGDYIGAKVQGITPEFVSKLRKQGLTGLTPDKIIALKVTGVF